jgi:type I restriction enzyme S subunit
LHSLNGSLSDLERAIESADLEIDLLREYRSCLIADVVTAKLDVREAAAHVPESVDEPHAIEEPEDFAEVDEDVEGEEPEEAVADAEL